MTGMTTGMELLASARDMTDAQVTASFGHGAPDADEVLRPALVATLVSSYSAEDAPLIRALTRHQISLVGESGCGDVLLAACWLLFMLGHVEDAALVWEAKNLNFDAHCYIDSVFLIPQGVAATLAYARREDLLDLAAWVEGPWLCDPEEVAAGWRSGSFFAQAPPSTTSVAELAAWIAE